MAFCKIYSGSVVGVEPHIVEVEVNIDYRGFPSFSIVGLPSKEIDESKERVRSAIKNSNIYFPNRRITVNLAPADIPKKGSLYDLPIALGILGASGAVKPIHKKFLVMGELSLSGYVNPVAGVIPLVLLARKNNYTCLLSAENARQASIIKGADIKPINNLGEL